jgi:hypothetical protein
MFPPGPWSPTMVLWQVSAGHSRRAQPIRVVVDHTCV